MNTKTHKKDEELQFLQLFLNNYNNEIKIIQSNREKPDFIIQHANNLIGIEVTKIFSSSEKGSQTLQAQESLGSKIIYKAHEYYKELGGLPVSVKVVFHPSYDLSSLPRDSTALELALFVKLQNGDNII